MKTIYFGLAFTFALANTTAHAIAAGSEGGGGGAQIESAFRIRARELVEAVIATPKATALCPAAATKKALTSAVRIVREINDPNGKCKSTQEFDACSYPGDIQLKEGTWERIVSRPLTKIANRSLDALVLHEIYRASEGCNDEAFVITEQVFPLVESTPVTAIAPRFSWSTCFVTQLMRDKSGKEETTEQSLEDTYVKWTDGNQQFSLGAREFEPVPGEKVGSVDQTLLVRTNLEDPLHFEGSTKGTYFDVNLNGKAGVTTETFNTKYESSGPMSKREVIDLTNSDPKKNLGKVVHNISTNADGVETSVQDQVEPDPVRADGVQRLSSKTLCTRKPIQESDVDYTGVFKVKTQVQRFSKSHEKAILAKDFWQTCQEKTPAEDCSVQKSAYDRADKDRLAVWNDLIKKSDLAPKRPGKGGGSGGGSSSGGRMTCGSASQQAWFDSCISRRPNCDAFQPGGACYGVDGTFSRCTGRRPPMRHCGMIGTF